MAGLRKGRDFGQMGGGVKVLIACEYSGIVRDAFIAAGHDAMSCDILATESPGPHYMGDVRDVLRQDWDLLIAHPPCTRLTNAGVRWLNERHLWPQLYEACMFFKMFLDADHIPRKAIENPIPHKYAVERIGKKYDQLIQPWQFGHGETKAVCLWLDGLPPLTPTDIVQGREARVHRMPPGPDRAKERSRFFPGIAAAMAEQWTTLDRWEAA